MGWGHTYNARGPDALGFRRAGGRPPFALRSRRRFVRRSALPSGRRPSHLSKEPIQPRAGPSSGWCCLCASASATAAVARQSARPYTAASCRGRRPRSCSAGPIRSDGKRSSSSSKMFWPAPNATSTCWSTWMRRTSTRMRISAMAGPNAASVYGSPRPRRACPRASRSMECPWYNEGQVRLWPYPRANGDHTIAVLRRLRAAFPDEALIVLWDGAPYHRAKAVREAATALDITLMPLPGYSPDLMPVEELWHWLREDVTYHHCHPSADDLTRRVADFEGRLNRDPFVIADRLWVKDHLDPEEEKLRFSK